MSEGAGKVVQVMGPVVDVEFPGGKVPSIYNALKVTNPSLSEDSENLTLEVGLHLGNNIVRTIAMDGTEHRLCNFLQRLLYLLHNLPKAYGEGLCARPCNLLLTSKY